MIPPNQEKIPPGSLHTNLIVFVSVFKAVLSDSEEVGRPCIYKYWEPWLGSSLAIAEGKSTALLVGRCSPRTMTTYRLRILLMSRHNIQDEMWCRQLQQHLPAGTLISRPLRKCKLITMQ
jgi:hypothetical protein